MKSLCSVVVALAFLATSLYGQANPCSAELVQATHIQDPAAREREFHKFLNASQRPLCVAEMLIAIGHGSNTAHLQNG
jgi:hypothetical protein